MNKIFKISLLLIVVVSFPLIFFGCNKKPKQLTTPISVGLVHNEIYNETTEEYEGVEILLVTDKNKYAKGYRFYLTDSSDYTDLNNYVSFYSSNNYVNITEYYNETQTYHFFVEYIGDNSKYINSEKSEIKCQNSIIEKINAPYIQLIDENLYFFRIMNAESYELYETIIDVNNGNIPLQQAIKIHTLDSETFEYSLFDRFNNEVAPYYEFRYSLKAIAQDGYESSNFSNTVSYRKHITLDTVKNLSVNKNGNDIVLSWGAVDYATKYKVVINNDNENAIIVENDNKLVLNSYLNSYSTYKFIVQAIESDVLSFDIGEISNASYYDHTYTLYSPTNFEVSRNGEYLNISFDAVNLAENYTLEVMYNGNSIYTIENLEYTDANILISELFVNLDSDKNIIVKVKANGVGEYINESEFTQKDFTILKNS